MSTEDQRRIADAQRAVVDAQRALQEARRQAGADLSRINIGPGGGLDLDNAFTYHPPSEDQIPRYEALRATARVLAEQIGDLCPPSPERSIAVTRVREAVFWANAAIACNETPEES